MYVCTYCLFASTRRPLVSVITTLSYVATIIFQSVVSHAFCVLCVYSKFRHHPHPLDYLCAKFCFFRGLHCWASRWKKPRTQSLNQSLTQLIWCPGKASELHINGNRMTSAENSNWKFLLTSVLNCDSETLFKARLEILFCFWLIGSTCPPEPLKLQDRGALQIVYY